MVNRAGIINTIAATAPGFFATPSPPPAARRWISPMGVAVEWAGYVYIADTGNHRLAPVLPLVPTGSITKNRSQSGIAPYRQSDP